MTWERTNSLVTTLQSSDICIGKSSHCCSVGRVCVLPGVGTSVRALDHLRFTICHHDSVLSGIHGKAIISVYRWIRELPAVIKRQCKDWFQTDFSTVYRLPDLAFYLLNILFLHPWVQCGQLLYKPRLEIQALLNKYNVL